MRTTLAQIATYAGTSISTVSRVVNGVPGVHEDTRRKVLQAIEALDFRLANSQAKLRPYRDSILTIFPQFTLDVHENPYFTGVLAGINDTLIGSQWRLQWQLSSTSGDLDMHTRELIESGSVAGLILVSRSCTNANVELATKHGVPVVVVNRQWPGLNCVYVNDLEAGYDATKHLIDLGHKQVVYLGDVVSSTALENRFLGYKRAMSQLYGTTGKLYEATDPASVTQEFVSSILGDPAGCTAIVCSYDALAMALLQALRQLGMRVPEQISVVSFDNSAAAAYLDPPLTTMSIPLHDMGLLAASIMQHLLSLRQVQKVEICVRHELAVRQSTGPVYYARRGEAV